MLNVLANPRPYWLVLALVLATALGCHAQSLGMAPGMVRYEFKPGVPFEFELNVTNYGSTSVDLHVRITDLWYDENNQKIFSSPGTAPRSAANWIQFVPENFRLAANSSQRMKAIVTPPSAVEGGYYATLFVESQPVMTDKVTAEGKAVYTNMRLGCLVLLGAKGTETYNVTMDDLRVRPPSATRDLEATFRVDNGSNTHIFAVPRFAVLDKGGKLVAKAQGEEKRFLPGQRDTIALRWSGNLEPGAYIGVFTVVYDAKNVETKEVHFEVP